jgi:hypothetical protein
MVIRKPAANRSTPFTCEPERIEEHISFDLGKRLKISRLPADSVYRGGPLNYTSRYKLFESKDGYVLDVSRIFEVATDSHVCSVDTHKHYQELFKIMRRDLRQLVFFQ